MSECYNNQGKNTNFENDNNVDSNEWFSNMVSNCCDYATIQKEAGKHVVGIMCEFTPREIIMAADGIPACLCGGSNDTISDAERELPSNLCPLIKSTYGYHLKKTNPFLEMAELIVAETTCDGKKKMFEQMGKSRPMYVLELPQKSDDPDAFEHWVKELRKLKKELENRFSIEITEEKLEYAIKTMNSERCLRRTLAEQMAKDNPPYTGVELLNYKSIISGIPVDFDHYEKIIQKVGEARSENDNSKRVRVMLTGVPTAHGVERVLEIIENSGGIIVCQENCTGLKPIYEDVKEGSGDAIRAIAEKYFHLPCSVMTHNTSRLDLIKKLATEYKVDCVVDLVWQACLTYDIEAIDVKDLVENELGMPYLKIETDYSPSDNERIQVRVETLLETVNSDIKSVPITKVEVVDSPATEAT